MSVCLVMMVRDEAFGIVPTLESAIALGIDRWCVVDTGSTDETPRLVVDALAGIPGTLHRRTWRNFGENRTETFRLAEREGCDWLLLMDAEWEAHGRFVEPRADAGFCEVKLDGQTIWHPLILRSGLPWRFNGPVHERLDCDAEFTEAKVQGVSFTAGHFASLAPEAQAKRDARRTWDMEQLLAAHERNPRCSQTVFNLAITCRDMGDHQKSIEWFDLCVDLSAKGSEQRFYSYYMGAALTVSSTPQWSMGVARLITAWRERPYRAEPLWELANIYRQLGVAPVFEYFEAERRKLPLPTHDRLVHPQAYKDWPYIELDGTPVPRPENRRPDPRLTMRMGRREARIARKRGRAA